MLLLLLLLFYAVPIAPICTYRDHKKIPVQRVVCRFPQPCFANALLHGQVPYNTITYNSILEACVKCGDVTSAEAGAWRDVLNRVARRCRQSDGSLMAYESTEIWDILGPNPTDLRSSGPYPC